MTKRFHRRGIIAVTAAAALGAVVSGAPSTARAEDGAALVGDLHAAFGNHHARAVHAKGVILEGSFTPSAEAKGLSAAELFAGASVPVTVRFSDFTGIPDIPDAIDDANPRGFAVKFRVASGAALDIVTHSFNGFPTATADEFGELMRAIATSGPTAPKPTPLDRFLGAHPIAKTFLTTQKPPPVSYATAAYFGVNAFAFVDVAGKQTFVRYRLVPVAGEHYLDAESKKAAGPDYLRAEIAKRTGGAPVRFDWFAQVAEAGDKIDDPAVAWPDSRKLVKLGTISIDRPVADQAAIDKELIFLPGSPPLGIKPADPMLAVRDEAYPVSFSERQ
jgi:catalase